MRKKHLFLRRTIHSYADSTGEHHGLRRHLKAINLTTIGIGAIIGAGIFVITGQAAAAYAGPAVTISFVIAAIVCIFTGLCYAELSSLIPSSGGSYSYAYVSLGVFPAWIVGWTLTAQYLISVAVVAVGWSGYLVSILEDFGVILSSEWTQSPILYSAEQGWHFSGAYLNLPALGLVLGLGFFISIGIRAAANFNNAMVFIKLSAIVLFILIGFFYVDPNNWHPFVPANDGIFGQFGWSGVLRASGLLFFAFLGFDTVATLAQEAVNPQKDIPKGILGSLFCSTTAYILTGLVLTGVVSYTLLGVPDPMSVALNAMGSSFFWLRLLIKLAILAGLASVVLVQMLGQTRIFYAISKDGLLPPLFGKLHAKLRTPLFATFVAAAISLTGASLFPINVLAELVSIMALTLFGLVCLGVLILRQTHPEYKRPFKVPLVPFIPLLGAVACVAQMCFLPLIAWFQLFVWFFIGVIIYFVYSIRHSKLRKEHSNLPLY